MDFSKTFLKIYFHYLLYCVFFLITTQCLEYENFYVINLDSRPDRLAFMKEILKEIQQPFTRMEAIDGKVLEELCENKMPLPLNPKILYSCEDYIRDRSANRCLNGEIGAWLSHLQVYFQIVENFKKTGRDNPTVILEDDQDLDFNFKELVNESFSHLPSDWEVFYAGSTSRKEVELLGNNIAFAPKFWGAHAYVVRNAQVAKKFISLSNKSDCQIADAVYMPAIRNKELKGYVAHPQTLSSFVLKLGTDIQEDDKDISWRVKKLKNSTVQRIKKRKADL